MAYYPKSQIKTNLYTNGNDYRISDKFYKGHYYETSSGKKYTGKFPGDGENSLLIEISTPILPSSLFSLTPILPEESSNYPQENLIIPVQLPISLNDYIDPVVRFIPSFYYPKPTPQEIQQGAITRYFCKKGNEYKYIEINKDTFNKLQSQDKSIAWDLYTPISLTYYIASKLFNPTPFNIENQLGWNGFSQYARPLKV